MLENRKWLLTLFVQVAILLVVGILFPTKALALTALASIAFIVVMMVRGMVKNRPDHVKMWWVMCSFAVGFVALFRATKAEEVERRADDELTWGRARIVTPGYYNEGTVALQADAADETYDVCVYPSCGEVVFNEKYQRPIVLHSSSGDRHGTANVRMARECGDSGGSQKYEIAIVYIEAPKASRMYNTAKWFERTHQPK